MIDTTQKIITLASQYSNNKLHEITELSTFKDDLLLDSLSLTEFIIACEEELLIEIDLDDPRAYSIKTLKDLIEIIELTY